MKCWHCGGDLIDPPQGKIAFKAICDHCSAYLHCCKNCKNYKPGKPNDCLVPNTEFVRDRAAANYCEELVLFKDPPKISSNAKDAAKRLFGDDEFPEKKDLNSLFK